MSTPAATATTLAATDRHPLVLGLADDAGSIARLALIALVLVVGYLLTCWVWPFASCRRCSGDGKRRAPLGRAFRTCPRCDGSGKRIRAGRHLITAARRSRTTGRDRRGY